MRVKFWQKSGLLSAVSLILLGTLSSPVLAHHALGGRLPNNGFEGFVSGLAHPIIGLDHLAFIVALGLIASLYLKSSLVMASIFLFSTLTGIGVHLFRIDLPLAEIAIAASVLGGGLLLALNSPLNSLWITLGVIIAGIFHGYAYGEPIIGAQITPLGFYLLGLITIQGLIVLMAYKLGKITTQPLNLRFAGFALGGLGLAFLASAILG